MGQREGRKLRVDQLMDPLVLRVEVDDDGQRLTVVFFDQAKIEVRVSSSMRVGAGRTPALVVHGSYVAPDGQSRLLAVPSVQMPGAALTVRSTEVIALAEGAYLSAVGVAIGSHVVSGTLGARLAEISRWQFHQFARIMAERRRALTAALLSVPLLKAPLVAEVTAQTDGRKLTVGLFNGATIEVEATSAAGRGQRRSSGLVVRGEYFTPDRRSQLTVFPAVGMPITALTVDSTEVIELAVRAYLVALGAAIAHHLVSGDQADLFRTIAEWLQDKLDGSTPDSQRLVAALLCLPPTR
jgi:hypothetical protein